MICVRSIALSAGIGLAVLVSAGWDHDKDQSAGGGGGCAHGRGGYIREDTGEASQGGGPQESTMC